MGKRKREERNPSPERHIVTWNPRSRMNLIQSEYCIPPSVYIKSPPPGFNVRDGKGLEEGEVFFSLYHLQALRFPLHPLIHFSLYRFNLCPMQLNPNAFHVLSCVAILNGFKGFDLALSDVLYCYKVVLNRGSGDRYCLYPSDPSLSITQKRSDCDKHWKDFVFVVGGDWRCSELNILPIHNTFGELADTSMKKPEGKRISWLKSTICFPSSRCDPNHLLSTEMFNLYYRKPNSLQPVFKEIFLEIERLKEIDSDNEANSKDEFVFDEGKSMTYNLIQLKAEGLPPIPKKRKKLTTLREKEKNAEDKRAFMAGSGDKSSSVTASETQPVSTNKETNSTPYTASTPLRVTRSTSAGSSCFGTEGLKWCPNNQRIFYP